jgi:MinD superfamily P-loop ATPase
MTMKEIVIISGKGGTGKTSLTASYAVLGGENMVVADCDVDAADMHLLLEPQELQSKDFYSGKMAEIDSVKCTNCGLCAEKCRFNAIRVVDGQHRVESMNCEGCGYCSLICQVNAITMKEQNVGKWRISNTKAGNFLVDAALCIGAENSGKLVAKVKNEAKKIAADNGKDLILIDGSPGIGCPVVSSLSGADFVVLVTEPTLSGLHDLKRAYALVKKFNIKAGCIINKFDLNMDVTRKIRVFLDEENIFHISSLPYDESFIKAITVGKTVIEYDHGELNHSVTESWEKIKQIINNDSI